MVDIVSFGTGLLDSWRIGPCQVVGDSMESQLRCVADQTCGALESALHEIVPLEGGPDLFVVLCHPEMAAPRNLAPGATDGVFLIGTIRGEPSTELRQFAEASGGVAMPVCDEREADALGAEFCRRFLVLARSRPADFSLSDRTRRGASAELAASSAPADQIQSREDAS